MPRGTTLGALVTMFREQAGMAVATNLGQNQLPAIRADLRRTYRRLHADFAWPHLRIQREKPLYAGERYYSFPRELDFDRVEQVWVREVGQDLWRPLVYGIGMGEYNITASDRDERDDVTRRWKLAEQETFEVWPVPATSGHTLRFTGISRPRPLVDDGDIVDLDDDLIVLYAVGERLARDKAPDGEMKLQQARQHYLRLRANAQRSGPVDMRVSHDRGVGNARLPIEIDHVEGRL